MMPQGLGRGGGLDPPPAGGPGEQQRRNALGSLSRVVTQPVGKRCKLLLTAGGGGAACPAAPQAGGESAGREVTQPTMSDAVF